MYSLVLATLLATDAVNAVAAEKHQFNVSTASPAAAIHEFGEQSGVQILAAGEKINGKHFNTVEGEHSVDEGLRILLAGSGLTHRYVGDRAVALVAAQDGGGRAEATDANASSTEPALRANVVELDDVVVVGTRLRGGGVGDSHSPVVVFDQEDIARTGASNISDMLEYLPSRTFGPNEQNTSSGAQLVQLRGLTVGNTLVLINGRRTVASATLARAVGAAGFNLNTIPVSAVERIEVLSDSASAVYGADAVGGVVNIVLKKSVSEPYVSAYYGMAQDGADERRGSAGFGHDGERLRFSVLGDFFKRDFLLGTDRDFTNNQDFRRFGGPDFRQALSRQANVVRPGNVNLPGLNSPRATVPVGSTGVGLTPADFAATAGQTNSTSILQYASLVPWSKRSSAAALGDLSLTDQLKMFGEVFFSKQEDIRRLNPSLAVSQVVAADQAFNPFDVPVQVSYLFPDPQTFYSENKLIRGVLGMRGALGTWDWEVYGLNSSENGTSSIANQVNPAGLSAALNSAAARNPATALNVFTDGPLDPAIAALVLYPRVDDNYSSDFTQGSGFLRGSLFELPAGPLSVVFGGEWRREGVHTENRTTTTPAFVTADRKVKSGFAEARVPLVDGDMAVPVVRSLAFTLAGRYDDYTDFGNTTNPQYGLEWGMFPGFLVRASYGDAFRAPSLSDLFAVPVTTTAGAIDPRRGNQVTPGVQVKTGGNPNLQPEESDTVSAGFVYTPDYVPGLRTAVTYWRIKQDQRLQILNTTTLLANEAFFPNRVVRAAPTAADIAAGRPGALVSLDATNINSGSLDTDGVDFELSGSWQGSWGAFKPSLMATRIMKYDAQDFPSAAVTDRLGSANTQGAIPKTRATATLAWGLKGFGLTPIVRYISSYKDVTTLNVATGKDVGSQTLVDLQATVDFGTVLNEGAWTRGLRLRVGVQNLGDELPKYAQIGGLNGYDTSTGDLRGRFSYLTLEKSF